MARQLEGQVTIVGVAGRGDVDDMAEFVTRHELALIDHVADVELEIWQANGIAGQPAWIFIDGETGATSTRFGGLGEDGLRSEIEALNDA